MCMLEKVKMKLRRRSSSSLSLCGFPLFSIRPNLLHLHARLSFSPLFPLLGSAFSIKAEIWNLWSTWRWPSSLFTLHSCLSQKCIHHYAVMFLLCDNNDLIDGENEPSNVSKCLQCLVHSDKVHVYQPITNLQSYFAAHYLPSSFLTFYLFNVSLCHCCLISSVPWGGSPVATSMSR